jgi:oligoribonuclease NrnB/cAMP/cGMP phosphodiesterase (DHH superfamily)
MRIVLSAGKIKGVNKMTVLVYHHNDLDGICAAAIIVRKYGADNVKCISVQYNENTWNCEDVEHAEIVYVVDFTFPDMETLFVEAGNKLVWCDHHKTAMEQHKGLWDSLVKGERSLDYAGCELTWIYCYPGYDIPMSVKLIADRDLWKFKYELTKKFCAGANALLSDPLHEDWYSLFEPVCYNVADNIFTVGSVLISSQEKRVEHLYEAGFLCEIHGHNALLVNSTSDTSELGEYIYTHGIELAVIWSVRGDNVIVSLRSNTVDCAEIAKQYGGGGHKGAAGFSIPNTKYFPLDLL